MNEEKTSLYFWKLCPLQHIFGAFTITFIACTFSDVKPKSQGDQFLISHVCQQLFFFNYSISILCLCIFLDNIFVVLQDLLPFQKNKSTR